MRGVGVEGEIHIKKGDGRIQQRQVQAEFRPKDFRSMCQSSRTFRWGHSYIPYGP